MPTGSTVTARFFPALRRAVVLRDAAARTDADLLTAYVRDRDADAFAVLVRRHGPMVLGVCRRVVGDPHLADDAFQAAFLVLARRAASVRPRAAVGNWLWGVAYKTAGKARAVRARRLARERQVHPMPDPPAPAAADLWADVRPVIDEELARLPDRLRLPVVLCDLEGRPQRAVAEQLGVAPATLAGRLAQARRTLAARLTRRGVTLSGGALATLLTERAVAAVGPAVAGGAVKAAEAVAAGGVASGCVSAHAVDLCEGVLRMFLLTKLKAAGAGALAVLVLTGGVGYGPGLVRAGDTPGTNQGVHTSRSPKTDADAAFLDRLSQELRGDKATPVEHGYFAADRDAKKRTKVTGWFLTDDAVKAHQARKHGAADRLLLADVVSLAYTADGQRLTLDTDAAVRVWDVVTGKEATTGSVLLGGSVNSNAGVVLNDVLNERTIDVDQPARGDVTVYHYPDAAVARGVNYLHRVQADPPAAAQNPPAEAAWLFYDLPNADSNPATYWYESFDANAPARPNQNAAQTGYRVLLTTRAETDEAFLARATKAARGTGPTAVEKQYFAADKDAKKREKLLDLLLKDPAVAKKLGDDWKAKMLAPPATAVRLGSHPADPRITQALRSEYFSLQHRMPDGSTRLHVQPYVNRLRPAAAPADTFGPLVDALIAAKKTDEQVLEALTLAAAGRLPTDTEGRLVLAAVGAAADKKAAWVAVARALAPAGKK